MKKPLTWFVVFGVILCLTIIYLFFINDSVAPGPFGLPNWIYWFFAIEVLLVLAMILFTRYFWNSSERA